jgi:hypothetical protein
MVERDDYSSGERLAWKGANAAHLTKCIASYLQQAHPPSQQNLFMVVSVTSRKPSLSLITNSEYSFLSNVAAKNKFP